MARLGIAEETSREALDFYSTFPALGEAAASLLNAVYSPANPLPPLVREAVRMRMALANDCLVCKSARLVPDLAETFYAFIESAEAHPELYDAQIRAAISFAEKFAFDHLAIDDDDFMQLKLLFCEEEIAALGISCAYFSAFGRLTRVLLLDHQCPMPSTPSARASA